MAFGFMERALLTHDWSIAFVANNSSRHTPFPFNVATLWSALEGSIILWATILSGYLVATAIKFRKRATDSLVGWATLTMFVVSMFFFGLMLPNIGPADPFKATPFAIRPGYDGPGPNALLQNHILDGDPPAVAVPRLRRLHRAVRVRDRRARHRSPR